jgi:hypothetical protein
MHNIESINANIISFLTMIGLYLVQAYTMVSYPLSTHAKQLYNSNNVVRAYTDTVNDQIFSFKSLISCHYLEAPYSHWTVCYKTGTYGETRINADATFYNMSNTHTITCVGKSNSYKGVSSLIAPNIGTKNEVDTLILTHIRNRFVDSFVSRIVDDKSTGNEDVDPICSLVKTRNYFISIQYCHPDMTDPIIFELDKRFLIRGNELFSSCFVLRLLNYQSKPFKFDNKYVLKLLDSNMNSIELDFYKYIQLNSGDYNVCNLIQPEDKKIK